MNVDIDCSNERKIIETPHKTIYKNGKYIVPNSALIVYNRDNSYSGSGYNNNSAFFSFT